jgi:hypothetical protein
MKVQEISKAWERLEGLRQSYQFYPFVQKDIDGKDTTLDRLINKYEIEFGDWLEANPSATNSPNSLDDKYIFVNQALAYAIKNHVKGSEGRELTGGERIDVRGTVTKPVVVAVIPPKKKSNAPLIAAAVIGIIGSIGFLRHKRII